MRKFDPHLFFNPPPSKKTIRPHTSSLDPPPTKNFDPPTSILTIRSLLMDTGRRRNTMNSPKPHLLPSLHSSFTQNWRRHSSLANPILIHPLSPFLPPCLNSIHIPP